MSSIHQNYGSYQTTTLGVIVLATLLFVLSLLPPLLTVVFLVTLTAGITVVTYRLQNYLLMVFLVAFLLRLLIIAFDSVVRILPTPSVAPDHNQWAIELATVWTNGQLFAMVGEITYMRGLMAHILAPFYIVIGHSPISGRVGIACISLIIGYLIFNLACYVTDYQTSVFVALVVLFWPTIVYRSVVIQREIIVTVALLAFLWTVVQWLDSITPRTLMTALLTVTVVFVLRAENILLIAVVIGTFGLIKSRQNPAYLAGFGLLSIPLLLYFAMNFSQITGHGSTLSPSSIDTFAHARAHGNAAYLTGLHYNSWIDIVIYMPAKIMYFLFTPFPWQIRGIVELLVGISALALISATLLARRGFAALQRRPHYLTLLLSYLLTGIVTYSIIEMNYGAAVRRRIQFIPIILLLAVIGLSKLQIEIRW